MRPSQRQLIALVEYMEDHGDLSRLPYSASGRINLDKHWEELTNILNRDENGDPKSSEKWKKVWSDYKNNINKKAARKIASNGEVRRYAKLTDLEHRVLNIINKQPTPVVEEMLENSQEVQIEPYDEKSDEDQEAKKTLSQIRILGSLEAKQSAAIWNTPETSNQDCRSPKVSSDSSGNSSPIVQLEGDTPVQGFEGLTSNQLSNDSVVPHNLKQVTSWCEGKSEQNQVNLNKKLKYTDEVALHLLYSNRAWRKFKIQQHRDFIKLKREQNRLRELEIQTRKEWQAIGLKAVDLLSKIVNKYCRD